MQPDLNPLRPLLPPPPPAHTPQLYYKGLSFIIRIDHQEPLK